MPVVKNPDRTITAIQEGTLGLGQEDSYPGLANRTVGDSDLAECGLEGKFVCWFVGRVALVLCHG